MSPTNIPSKGRILYPQIPACTSIIDLVFREGSPITSLSCISNPITLEDIYSSIIAL